MPDDQNTVAGTTDGASLITNVGNWFSNQIAAISNVGVSSIQSATGVTASLGGLADSIRALKLSWQQAAVPPQQTTPVYQQDTAAKWYSDPANVQKALMISGVAATVIFGSIWLMKRK